ncbi:MAG TPA: hypothetical protein VGE00_08160, partial [Gammaproteobacteria bacterium]
GNSLDVSQQLKVMSERNLNHDYLLFVDVIWGKPEYYSHAHPDGAAAKRAYVVFQRHDNDQLVGESSVAFPAPFQIQAPAAEATLSRAVPLELTWSDVEPGSVMEFDVAGICSDDSRYTLHRFLGADSGSYTLHSADYFPTDQIEASQSCRVAIMLQRIKMEEVSSQFAFGNFKGVQLRTVEFTSTP